MREKIEWSRMSVFQIETTEHETFWLVAESHEEASRKAHLVCCNSSEIDGALVSVTQPDGRLFVVVEDES